MKLSIHGSCISRDIFHEVNEESKIVWYRARASLHSLCEKPLGEEVDVNLNSKFQRQCVIDDLRKTDIDTLILGCTHYPLLATTISNVLGPSIKLIDSSLATADKVKSMLENNNLLANKNLSEINCYVTDYTKTFNTIVNRFFKSNINSIKKIDVF